MSDKTRAVEQKGIKLLGYLLSDFDCLIREVHEHDKGIDAEVELSSAKAFSDQLPLIGVQVKSRTKAKRLVNGDFSLTVSNENVSYWRSYGRPVILFLHDGAGNEMYWCRVDNCESRTIHIPSKQNFSSRTVSDLLEVCGSYLFEKSREFKIADLEPVLDGLAKTYGEISSPIIDRLNEFYRLFSSEDFAGAASRLSPVVEIYSSSKDMVSNMAVTLMRANDRKAIRFAKDLLCLDDLNADYIEAAASVYAQFEEYQMAMELYEKAISMSSSIRILNNYALTCYWRRDLEKAFELFGRLSLLAPQDEKILFNFALVSTAIEKYQNAIKLYSKAISINRRMADAYNNKGLLLQALGKHHEAYSVFCEGIEECSQDYFLNANLSRFLKDYGRNDEALGFCRKALSIKEDPRLKNDLALLLCRSGNITEAESLLSENIHLLVDVKSISVEGKSAGIFDMGYTVIFFLKFVMVDGCVSILKIEDCSSESIVVKITSMAKEMGIPEFLLLEEALRIDDPKSMFGL